MDTSAAQTAVSFALSGKWNEAISANLKILDEDPNDTQALCRLARAYFELEKYTKSQQAINTILKIEPTNQIALKFVEKLKISKKSKGHVPSSTCAESFLEEPGKTRMVNLLHLGNPENFVQLDPGEEVKLAAYSHRVSVNTLDGKYIGRLPDDIGARLKYLIKKGNKYQTLIKSINPKTVTVFIREIEQGADINGFLSFPPEKIDYVSFTPPELVHKDIPNVETTEGNSEE